MSHRDPNNAGSDKSGGTPDSGGLRFSEFPCLIGLSAKKRHGKDTLAALLCKVHGYRRIAFADALYREVSDLYGVSVEFLQNPDTKETPLPELGGLSPRRALQDHGMRRRGENAEYWVRQVADVIAASPEDRWVVTDVRLPNEARWVQERGPLIRIHRPGLPPSGDTHVSETALDDWPFFCQVLNEERTPERMLADLDLKLAAVTDRAWLDSAAARP